MKVLSLLCLAGMVAASVAVFTCQSKLKGSLQQFNGRSTRVAHSCKYMAVRRQPCGKFRITISPGHRYLYPRYQVDTLWVGIDDMETGDYWEGRTTNKLAVKYLNTEGDRPLFNKKDGTVSTQSFVEFGREAEGVGVYLKPKNSDDFKVVFTPWDPYRRSEFPNAEWRVECNVDSANLNPYSKYQICGSDASKEVNLIAKAEPWDLPDRFDYNVVYYDTFTNAEIVQTNPKCTNATTILTQVCSSDAQRRNAINNCALILESERHTECVTNYNCDPMDVFNACLLWGCTGSVGFEKEAENECAALAEGIDFCNDFGNSGNLTERVKAAKCYKDFISISTEVA